MAIKLCHHIKEDGIYCKSAALDGRDYCYHHLIFRGRRLRIAQHRARQTAWRLELPPLEDLNGVQVAIMQVLDAITGDRINRHDAGLVLYGLQQAACNLRGKEGRVCLEVDPSAENRVLSYDSFEEDFELTEDDATAGEIPDASGAAEVDPTLSPPEGDEGAPATGEKIAAERVTDAAHCSVIIEKIHAVADDARTPKKLPRGLRPPKAQRLSAEAAAALAKAQQATAPECGRLDTGEILKCKQCGVLVYKRLAQFWEGRKHPDDWLPTTGTIDCLDCQLKHLTTLGRHLDEQMPMLFHLFMILEEDGGETPGEFDDYCCTLTECLARTGKPPDGWSKRLHSWTERGGREEVDEDEDAVAEEEDDLSA